MEDTTCTRNHEDRPQDAFPGCTVTDGGSDDAVDLATSDQLVVDEEGGGDAPKDENAEGEKPHRRSRRSSSLQLRKVPEHILLSSQMLTIDDLESASSYGGIDDRGDNDGRGSSRIGWLLRSCLNPKFSLRTQMMISFGSVSAVTILLVMITAIIASVAAGNSIKTESTGSLEQWIMKSLGTYARFVAETLSPKIMPNDLVQIMYETTRDRFAGYPDFADDSRVPFFSTTNQTNVYPLESPPLPLDWEFVPEQGSVNSENYKEHVQNRWSWYNQNPRLSSVSSFYVMQGACDPRETDPNAMSYSLNCTDANNNISTGGVVAPTPTNEQVARKAAELSPFLKALYEHHQDVKELGIFFSNSGAGSGVQYPHYEINGRSSYTSVGCDWMKAPNPIDPSRPIGTQEEIDRCHPEGEVVPSREYNPLERPWCRDQALNQDKIQNIGPFQDAWNRDVWLMLTGRAVYDRVTAEFTSCVWVSFTLDRMKELIDDVGVNAWSMLTLVRWDEDGTVVVSPSFDYDAATETTVVDDESLGIGVTKSMFENMKLLVDFSEPWDPEEAREAYETTFYENEGRLISSYPIPPVPAAYDSAYSPEFMVILTVDRKQEIDQAATKLKGAVDDEVNDLILFTVIVGFVGLAVVFILIYAVSDRLTEPLEWMAKVTDQIVGSFGEDLETEIDYERKKTSRFSPKTELRDLVQEFTKMLSKFSGEGMAKSARVRWLEVRNRFNLFDQFRDLYQSRKEEGFEYDYEPCQAESEGQYDEGPDRLHVGPNVNASDTETTVAPSVAQCEENKVFTSPLFLWIVALIVTPLIATTVSISAVVLWNISTELPLLVVPVQDHFLELRSRTRYTAAKMRAVHASGVTGRSARDLHVLTRLASWLFFGGVRQKGSITEMKSGAEECKSSIGRGACDYFHRQPCDCAWNDFLDETNCSNYVDSDSRFLEKVWFEGQSRDALPNGDRNHTTFPKVDYSPETTAWWSNVVDVPGNETGPRAAAGHETTYDRLKVVSALSAAFIPLFRYDTSADRPLALFIGFEADGMFTGYSGCDSGHVDFPFFVSSESNGAFEMRPELCPKGKYGFDARCRGWYDKGMKMAMDMENAGPLYITPPYKFANNDLTAQSASSPLIDPKTQTHIGQTLVDFLPDEIFRLLQESTPLANGGFPLLITPDKDSLGFDTVIGPGFSLDDIGKSVEELVLPHDNRNCDEDDCANLQAFGKILDDMRAGNSASTEFSRTTAGGVIEQVQISYAPVVVKSYWPLNSSDFSSGVQEYDSLIYSLALAEPEYGILQPFQAIEDTVNKQVNICIGVLSALIFVATAFLLFISSRVTASMTESILHLLGLIRKINSRGMQIDNDSLIDSGDFPGSSREIVSVYDTMQMLYKIVRFANAAFFAGDLDEAYPVLRDALRLFQRLGNRKAIAVTCNNLGNTMLTMYRTMKVTEEAEICGLNEKEIITKGVSYFQRAIKLGEEAYDQFYEEEGWSKNCLGFMEHLANRYFNRAIFLLTVKDDHPRPKEAMSLGFRDLQIVQDMDVEVVDQCNEVGFSVDKVERFELVMNRIRGLLTLAKMGYEDDLGIEEHIDEVVKEMKAEVKNPASELFESMGPAGRMQQLDTELIKYARYTKKDTTEAARIAIRMLVEDDYTFPAAQYRALNALVDYVDAQGSEEFATRKTLRLYQSRLETGFLEQVSCRRCCDDSSMQVVKSARNFNTHLEGKTPRASAVSIRRISASMKESSRGDFTMEMF